VRWDDDDDVVTHDPLCMPLCISDDVIVHDMSLHLISKHVFMKFGMDVMPF
jgi:hypothetical protein